MMNETPQVGKKYRYLSADGQKTDEGEVRNIARFRTGLVVAYLTNGKCYPISKHGRWVLLEKK